MKKFLIKVSAAVLGVVTLALSAAWIGFVLGVVWGLATRGYDYAQYLLGLL